MRKAPGEKPVKQYVALLRGINVGGHTVIKMEKLRAAFESLGYRNVKTVLTSGNVLFEAPGDKETKLSQDISQGLNETLGREVLVIVRSLDDLRELAASQPFGNVDNPDAKPIVTLLPGDNVVINGSGLPSNADYQVLNVSGGIICSIYNSDAGAADFMVLIEKEFGRNVTTRTWNTIARILKASEKS